MSENGLQTASPTRASRDVRVELLRIIAMLFIVACHATLHLTWLLHVEQGLTPTPGWKTAILFAIVQFGQVGVSIFFAISGYFLVGKKFTWTRLFKPWFQVICYTVLAFIVTELAYLTHHMSANIAWPTTTLEKTFLVARAFMPITFNAYWFMTAYMIMICLSPFISLIFEYATKKQVTLLMTLMAVIGLWVLLGGRVAEWNNIIYACLGFMIGGWIRRYAPASLTSRQRGAAVLGIVAIAAAMLVFNFVGSLNIHAVTVLGWSSSLHNGIVSPPMDVAALAIAGLFLLLVTRERAQRSVAQPASESGNSLWHRIIPTIAGTTFGIYLIHENQFGFHIVWGLWERVWPAPTGAMKIVALIVIVLVTFVVLGIVAWVVDTVLVHPLQKAIISRVNSRKQK